MQLTKHTDYAFRILLFLGRLPAGERSSVAELSAFYDISANHLAKVVMRLGQLGWIDTARGKGGGIALSQTALAASAGDIVRAFEPRLEPVDCYAPACGLLPDCRLKSVLAQAMAGFMQALDGVKLAELLARDDVQVLTLLAPDA